MTDATPTKAEIEALVGNIQDATNSYDPTADHGTFYDQRANIRTAAIKLLNATSEPIDTTWSKLSNMVELVTIRAAFEVGLFDAVPLEGSISNSDLAAKVNASETLIARQMRILVGTGVFDQTTPTGGDYKHTRFSESFRNLSKGGLGSYLQSIYSIYLKTCIDLDQYLLNTKKDGLYVEPTSNFHNPFSQHYGTDGMSVWEAMAQHPSMMNLFQLSLAVTNKHMPPVGPFYAFSQFKATSPSDNRIQLVDIGGGYGQVLMSILTATPALDPKNCVLQDIESVIDLAHDAQKMGIQTQIIDFHKEQPVQSARAYYMRFVSHDYNDGDLVNILSYIAAAMDKDSKLLVADNVIPERLSEGTLPAGVLDMIMFAIGGKERTKRDFESVFEKAGLRLNAVCYMPGSTGAIVEAVKV